MIERNEEKDYYYDVTTVFKIMVTKVSFNKDTALLHEIASATYARDTYRQIEHIGPASPPLAFDAPQVNAATTLETCFCVPRQHPNNSAKEKKKIDLLRAQNDWKVNRRAYIIMPGTTLTATLCGEIRLCSVAQLVSDDDDDDQTYKETGETVVIKMDKRQTMKHLHDDTPHPIAENPWKEVSAMEFLGKDKCPYVMQLIEALKDQDYLYEIMTYCPENLDSVMKRYPQGLEEDTAREYFKEILFALHHMHSHGVCHRDISTQNILINEFGHCVLIDFGMCLRVPYPYLDDCRGEDVTDYAAGTPRRLIHSQTHCGKVRFMAPEMYKMLDFDGLSVDLWSCGVVLFVMLTSRYPYGRPEENDSGFHDLLDECYYWDPAKVPQSLSWGRTISPVALDLLRGILHADPRERLTLAQVAEHPWLRGEPLPQEKSKAFLGSEEPR